MKNLDTWYYWSGTADAADPQQNAWAVAMNEGRQGLYSQTEFFVPWAVRDGDIRSATVPALPPAGVAALALLIALVGVFRGGGNAGTRPS